MLMRNVNILGFGRKEEERPLTELEEKLGFRFVEIEGEPFPNEVGKFVRLRLRNGYIGGLYCGLNEKGYFIIVPHLTSETFSGEKKKKSPNLKDRVYWETERPEYVHYIEHCGLSPERQEYLDSLAEKPLSQVLEENKCTNKN